MGEMLFCRDLIIYFFNGVVTSKYDVSLVNNAFKILIFSALIISRSIVMWSKAIDTVVNNIFIRMAYVFF